ncbi:hypothetical protein Ancab_035317 [Ancistrocladus abbreviatus]
MTTIGVRACATSGHRNDSNQRRRSSSSNWWSPLFGWSSDPDYIDSNNDKEASVNSQTTSEVAPEPKAAEAVRSRFVPGCFTEEKARQLRKMRKGTESFHDAMYHSAIASRLASDFSNRSDL